MFAALKHLFKLQFLIILLAIFAGVYYQEILDRFKSMIVELADDASVSVKFTAVSQNRIYTKEELAKFTGETEEQPIYLSILGSVYDVTKGRKHYGPGCSYSYFAGRDASKSFISGEFEEFNENSDDVMLLSPSEILSLYEWKKFYDKEYTFKGLAEGRWVKEDIKELKQKDLGKVIAAEYEKSIKSDVEKDAIADQAFTAKLNENQLRELYPPCNIQWTEEKGTRVWCTSQSGGIKRDWIGVPRKYFQPGTDTYRCACVQESELDSPHLKPYDNCDRLSPTCYYKID